MTQPIPTRGLLGAWVFDERMYDAQRDEVHSLNPTGYPAKLKNGVTMGQSGDPARELEAAKFDDASNQYAQVGDPLGVAGEQAIVAIVKPESINDGTKRYISANEQFPDGSGAGFRLSGDGFGNIRFDFGDGTNQKTVTSSASDNEYVSIVGGFASGNIALYTDGVFQSSQSNTGHTAGNNNMQIGARSDTNNFFDGEIAAVGRYDLTVPNAPEPSEIATAWDRLTDIPATR